VYVGRRAGGPGVVSGFGAVRYLSPLRDSGHPLKQDSTAPSYSSQDSKPAFHNMY
jgi:hypothetical protein